MRSIQTRRGHYYTYTYTVTSNPADLSALFRLQVLSMFMLSLSRRSPSRPSLLMYVLMLPKHCRLPICLPLQGTVAKMMTKVKYWNWPAIGSLAATTNSNSKYTFTNKLTASTDVTVTATSALGCNASRWLLLILLPLQFQMSN